MITGSLGLLPSASLSDPREGGVFGLYEPIHGSAPDIAGQGKANPIAAILSTAMMLQFTFNDPDGARRIENAVDKVLADGLRTADLVSTEARPASTTETGDAIAAAVSRSA